MAETFYSIIRSSVSELEYDFWFRDLEIAGIYKNHYLFEVTTTLHRDWVTTHYCDLFFDSLDKAMGAESTCQFFVKDEVGVISEKMDLLYERITEIEKRLMSYLKNIFRTANPISDKVSYNASSN
ncbi:hypothetical protein LJK88_09890 [Paenibacillus sp. P26]|nr:hypothetical protein LJK88_09890 [Paenibacillus sp. P26]